jgi:hypothetical protein
MFVPRASANPPPWAGARRHAKHDDGDHDRDDGGYWSHRHSGFDRDSRYGRYDRPDWGHYRQGNGDHDWDDRHYQQSRHRDEDHDTRYERDGRPYYGGYGGYRGNDPEYYSLIDRINLDRARIAENEATGRHKKALQWYRDDLRNAERDMNNYRYQGTGGSYDSYYPSGGYYPSGSNYDPYYGAVTDPSFNWKRDWPTLLGSVINAQIGK